MNKDNKLILFEPKPTDVVLSKSKKWTEGHPGNVAFQGHLETFRAQMQATTPPSKSEVETMVDAVIHLVYAQHGRFLKPDQVNSDYCEELTRANAAPNVENALRKMRNDWYKQKYQQKSSIKPTVVKRAIQNSSKYPIASATTTTVITTTPTKGKRGRPRKDQSPFVVAASRHLVTHDDNDDNYESDEPSDHEDRVFLVDAVSNHPPPAAVSREQIAHALIRPHHHHHHGHAATTAAKSSHRHSHPSTSKWKPQPAGLQAFSNAVRDVAGTWTYPKLYGNPAAAATLSKSNNNNKLYGCPDDQMLMRHWINNHHLPQAIGDLLLDSGARNVQDIVLLMQTSPQALRGLAVLDAVKLQRAVESLAKQKVVSTATTKNHQYQYHHRRPVQQKKEEVANEDEEEETNHRRPVQEKQEEMGNEEEEEYNDHRHRQHPVQEKKENVANEEKGEEKKMDDEDDDDDDDDDLVHYV